MAYDISLLVKGLSDADAGVRLSAAVALEDALREELEQGRVDWEGLVSAILPGLIEAIGDPHKGVQVHAAGCLQFLAYQSGQVLPALQAAMAGPDAWRAWGAALVGARTGLWCAEMGPALAAAMGAADRDVRWAAAGVCLELGRSHPEAVATVRGALADGNPLARKMAAYCLGAMGQYADVERDLAARLDDPERDVRRAIILGLDKLPSISAETKSKIAAMAGGDPDEYVRRTAAAVYTKFAP